MSKVEKGRYLPYKKITAAAAVTAVAVLIIAVVMTVHILQGWLLASWEEKNFTYDLRNDGTELEFAVKNRSLTISDGNGIIWESPGEWKVEDAGCGDLDGDGVPEMIILCWRRGNYGPSKPFWVEKNDMGFSQHIFILNMKDEKLQQKWFSSGLRPEVAAMAIERGDAKDRIRIETKAGEDTLWEWDDFGLVRIDF